MYFSSSIQRSGRCTGARLQCALHLSDHLQVQIAFVGVQPASQCIALLLLLRADAGAAHLFRAVAPAKHPHFANAAAAATAADGDALASQTLHPAQHVLRRGAIETLAAVLDVDAWHGGVKSHSDR